MPPTNAFYAVSSPNMPGHLAFGKSVKAALTRFGLDLRIPADSEGHRLLSESYAVVPLLHLAVYRGLGETAPRIDLHDPSVPETEDTQLSSYEMGGGIFDPATSLSLAYLRLVEAADEFDGDDEEFVAEVGQAEEDLRQNILEWVEAQPENVEFIRGSLKVAFVWAGFASEDWASGLVENTPTPLEMVDVIQDAAVERYRRTANYMMENLTVSVPQPRRSPSP